MINYFLHDGIRCNSEKEYSEHKTSCPIYQAFWKPAEEDFAKRLTENLSKNTFFAKFTTKPLQD